MNIGERISNLLSSPNQQPGPLDDQPWYIKYGTAVLGILGAILCIIFGLLNMLSFIVLNISCVISGILEILIGLMVIMLEAPACCFCIDYVGQMSDWVNGRPLWYKAAFYCISVTIPLYLCFGWASLFAYALIFSCGVMYGLISLGKKASIDMMRQAAMNSNSSAMGNNTTAATNDRATIINNAQPFSFTGAVGTDSNV